MITESVNNRVYINRQVVWTLVIAKPSEKHVKRYLISNYQI